MSLLQFSCSDVFDSLQPRELQHSRLPCPSPTGGASQTQDHWIGDAILPLHPLSFFFFSHFQSFPASGSFPIRLFFASGGQSIGVSASASVLPMNIQDWVPLRWTGWIQGTLKSFLQHHSSKATILRHSTFFIVQLSDPYMTTGKTIALTRWAFVSKVMSLF